MTSIHKVMGSIQKEKILKGKNKTKPAQVFLITSQLNACCKKKKDFFKKGKIKNKLLNKNARCFYQKAFKIEQSTKQINVLFNNLSIFLTK